MGTPVADEDHDHQLDPVRVTPAILLKLGKDRVEKLLVDHVIAFIVGRTVVKGHAGADVREQVVRGLAKKLLVSSLRVTCTLMFGQG